MKRWMALGLVLVLCVCCAGCAAKTATRRSVVGFYFDTVIMLNAYCDSDDVLNDALGECARYEALLSKTREGSDVWRMNHADGAPVAVSEETAEILRLAIEIGEKSSGAFDVTVCPAQALWDFTGANNVLPDADQLRAAAARIDYRNIALDGNTVTLQNGATVDLGGVAKGYIADRIGAYLRDRGVNSALLNFGGNVLAVGQKPEGAWAVGIRDPEGGQNDYLLVVNVRDTSVVTSGVYERGFDLDGVRYHHILDTKTGWPVQNGLASATIIAESSATADALSTAVFALGIEDGLALIESMDGVEAILIDGARSVSMSSGARAYLAQ